MAQLARKLLKKLCFNLRLDKIEVTHLYVVPDLWKHMLGDDWLNNEITRERFSTYLESELAQEIDETIYRIQNNLSVFNTKVEHKVVIGNPIKELISTCQEDDYQLVITGSARPKTMSGLKSRMIGKRIAQKLPMKYLQVPHPHVYN